VEEITALISNNTDELSMSELKLWCKANGIKGYSVKKIAGLSIELMHIGSQKNRTLTAELNKKTHLYFFDQSDTPLN